MTKFQCPVCDNTNMEEMSLILVDNDWCRYDFEGTHEDGTPMFSYRKSVYTEAANDFPPKMECRRFIDGHFCNGEWEVTFGDYKLI